jgi:sterol desaturase/sphingolipid hydroxylase (fatty acid hydroxylase superfamily)
MDWLTEWFAQAWAGAQQAVFEGVVQPLLFAAGASNLLEDAFRATGWLLLGVLQMVFVAVVFGALERWRPVEPRTAPGYDRQAVRVDILYTVLHRLGLFRVGLFLAVDPLWDAAFGAMSLQGWQGAQLDQALAPWWPGVTDTAVFALLVYVLVFDFVDYWIHRGQHGLRWWWSLHALHHSQRQMTMWSDNRNHLLDDLIRDSLLVLVAKAIGIAPSQFVAIVVATQLLESLSHANVRWSFGTVLQRVLVSPRFHRVHHGIGVGHESQGRGTLGGHNFAVLLPVWDMLFGTADFTTGYGPTGIRDQLPEEGGRDYGRGFWRQQWLGLARMLRLSSAG